MLFRFLDDIVLDKYKRRAFVLFLLTLFFLFILVLRFYHLQLLNYNVYQKKSESNRVRILRVNAKRGFIKDVDDRILVKNAPSYNLNIVRENINDIDRLLGKLSKIIDIDIKQAKEKILNSYYYNPVTIFRGLDFSVVSYLFEHLEEYPGIRIDMDSVRNYKNSYAYSHIVGYMGEINKKELKKENKYRPGDLIGKTGIEKVYEKVLKGENGAKQVEVNSLGQVVKTLDTKPATPGNNVILSINLELQKFIRDLLKDKKGGIVVLDILNNNVAAMYSSPSYDLNKFVPYISSEYWDFLNNSPSKPFMNRVIEGNYPPGSVFKLMMAAAALEENTVTPDDEFFCDGTFEFGSYRYKCWKKHGHGDVDMNKSIIQSCDIYYYNLGLKLGIDTISNYAHNFYLGKKTGIDLPNEKKGLFPSRKWKKGAFSQSWYPGETIITSIGQGYTSVTPLQMAVMMSGLFNGGMIYEPSLVKGFETGSGFKPKKTKVLNQVDIDESTRKFLLDATYETVYGDRGTAYRARVKGVKVGGKTGTAQVVSLEEFDKYEEGEVPEKYRDHSWFGGVFPVDNPRYVVVSLVEHGGSGSQSATSTGGAVINKMVKMGYVSNR